MHDQNSHNTKNSETDFFDDLLKYAFSCMNKAFRCLLEINIEKKKAISLTAIIMTLAFFLGSRGVFILDHILSITFNYNYLWEYAENYIVFFVMWAPAIYFLSLYWNSKNIKFRLSLGYAVGLLTYRFNNDAWELYDLSNFISCVEFSGLFVCIAAILIYFVRGVKE